MRVLVLLVLGVENRIGEDKTPKLDVRRRTLTLQKLGLDADYWAGHVNGFRSAYRRFVGSVEAMTEKAAALKQQWLKGIGYARSLAANR